MSVAELAATDLQSFGQTDRVVLFYAPWCGHCQRFMPAYQTLAASAPHITFTQYNASDGSSAMQASAPNFVQSNVQGYPTLIFDTRGRGTYAYDGPRDLDSLTRAYKQTYGDMPTKARGYWDVMGIASSVDQLQDIMTKKKPDMTKAWWVKLLAATLVGTGMGQRSADPVARNVAPALTAASKVTAEILHPTGSVDVESKEGPSSQDIERGARDFDTVMETISKAGLGLMIFKYTGKKILDKLLPFFGNLILITLKTIFLYTVDPALMFTGKLQAKMLSFCSAAIGRLTGIENDSTKFALLSVATLVLLGFKEGKGEKVVKHLLIFIPLVYRHINVPHPVYDQIAEMGQNVYNQMVRLVWGAATEQARRLCEKGEDSVTMEPLEDGYFLSLGHGKCLSTNTLARMDESAAGLELNPYTQMPFEDDELSNIDALLNGRAVHYSDEFE